MNKKRSMVNPYQNKDHRKSSIGARSTSAGVRHSVGSLAKRSIALTNEQMYSSMNPSEKSGIAVGTLLDNTKTSVFKSYSRKNTARLRQSALKDGTI